MNATIGLLFVIGLIFLCAYFSRRFGLAQNLTQRSVSRLKIISRLPLDARNRLVLIRKDNKEYLILLGASSSQVIDSGYEKEEEKKDA